MLQGWNCILSGVGWLARKQVPAGVSHDPKDAPKFTHKLYTVYWSYLHCDILAIQDDDRTHYPFLKQWVGMEVDIENQWSLNNGTLGLDMVLHNAGKHRMEYCVRLRVKDAKLFLKTKHQVMGIINEQKRLVYVFQPLKTIELAEFVEFKLDVDKHVKSQHLSPKAWSVE